MKFCNKSENIRRAGAGRRIIALLMVLLMITASLPVSGGYLANAEGVSGSDAAAAAQEAQQPASQEPAPREDAQNTEDTAEESEDTADLPQETPAEEKDKHVCVITGFGGFTPGQPLDTVVLKKAEPINRDENGDPLPNHARPKD